MEEKEELVIHFGIITFLATLLGVSIYRIKKGLDTKQVFSVFWAYSGIDYTIKYKKSKKKYDAIMALLSFANAILLTLLQCKEKKQKSV